MIAMSRQTPIVNAAFAEIAGGPVEPLDGRWSLRLGDTPIEAGLATPWLVMTSPAASAAAPIELLGWNGTLPGQVRFALSDDGEPGVRAEIPLDEEEPSSIREAWLGFKAARALLRGEQAVVENFEPLAPISQNDLLRLAEEAGWAATSRSDNSVAVELECPGAFAQASFAQHTHGFRVSVPLASFEDSQSVSQSAIEILLLTAATHVRLARPVLELYEGKVAPRFEVVFSALPSVAQLAHALSSLSVAYRFCADEVKALQNADVAGDFLALRRGHVAAPGPQENTDKTER